MTWYNQLGLQHPLFQGGMSWASNAELVAAVSNSGALGIIGSGGRTAKELKKMIRKTKKLTSHPFGVNLMLLDKNIEQLLEVICEEKITIITTGAGTPKKYIEKIAANNIKLFPVVPNVKIAKKMLQLPISGLIVEGTEAGGHVGKYSLNYLLEEIVPISHVPVIAAGGIYDNSGFTSVVGLGATGVQIGTAFLVAQECNISLAYKKLILQSKEEGTATISNNHGHLVRALDLPSNSSNNKSLKAAVDRGDLTTGVFMAGIGCTNINKIEPAKNIMNRILGL